MPAGIITGAKSPILGLSGVWLGSIVGCWVGEFEGGVASGKTNGAVGVGDGEGVGEGDVVDEGITSPVSE